MLKIILSVRLNEIKKLNLSLYAICVIFVYYTANHLKIIKTIVTSDYTRNNIKQYSLHKRGRV